MCQILSDESSDSEKFTKRKFLEKTPKRVREYKENKTKL